MSFLRLAFSLRSRRKHKAWGASPRYFSQTASKPAQRATALPPAARAQGLIYRNLILGLAPQALFCRSLRELWLTGGAVGSGREVLLEEFGGGFEEVVGGYDAD